MKCQGLAVTRWSINEIRRGMSRNRNVEQHRSLVRVRPPCHYSKRGSSSRRRERNGRERARSLHEWAATRKPQIGGNRMLLLPGHERIPALVHSIYGLIADYRKHLFAFRARIDSETQHVLSNRQRYVGASVCVYDMEKGKKKREAKQTKLLLVKW